MSTQSTPILEQQASRREVMKKAAYMAPAILTLAAIPAFAAKGSGWKNDKPKVLTLTVEPTFADRDSGGKDAKSKKAKDERRGPKKAKDKRRGREEDDDER